MKNLIVLVLLLNVYFGFSQNDVFDYKSLRDELKVVNENGQISNNSQELKGSPYLFEEFVQGKIIQDGRNDLNAYFKYNALQDVVEIKLNPNHSEIFILPRVDKFVFKLEDYSFFIENLITNEGEVLAGYKLKYYESENILFIGKSNSMITAAKSADTSYDRAKPSEIINNMNYYISFNGDPLISVKIKEKYFRKLMNDSPKMKSYFKENKVKDIEDIKNLLEYYEDLSS